MVSNHGPHQVAGNPKEPSPPCKFHNYWTIRTPPGWSCLFVPPLNRSGQPFECVAGVVDTDTYAAHIHFPFFATAPDGLYIIEKGTPLVQIIPFRRDSLSMRGGDPRRAGRRGDGARNRPPQHHRRRRLVPEVRARRALIIWRLPDVKRGP